MREAGETPEPGEPGDGSGLGARLAAVGGAGVRSFDAVPAGPEVPLAGGPGVTRTDEVAEKKRPGWRGGRVIPSVVALVLVGCLGAAAVRFVDFSGPSRPTRAAPQAVPSAGGGVEAAAGPRASDQPVRADDDLDRVCGDTYFPAAPKYRGDGPHPVMISVRESLSADGRFTRTLNRAAYGGSAAQRRTWAPAPRRAQLVACLDLTGPGRPIRDCKSGDRTLSLVEGRYRLTVYEVATRREVAGTALTGGDRACPFVILTSAGPTLYSAVKDQQLYDLLRRRVEG
ncbi:hypothetical protein [Actinoplanes sp. NPDC049802]|uniref:hypothetical protein n=1 Tax=Actinoplanes sp. NPDC049802 TaxID=3154742 RepID=UPI0033CDE140